MKQLSEANVARPAPGRTVSEQVSGWVSWIGVGRLIASAFSVLVVCVGAFWLVRSPPPSAEAILPVVGPTTEVFSTLTPPPPAQVVTTTIPIGPVVVHVAGAVAAPGVYELRSGDRVDDALLAAGGPLLDAATDALNLAALLIDGSRIYVPVDGEIVASIPLVEAGSPAGEPVPIGPVDINVADASRLESLPGVGPATAAAIIAEREGNGPFLVVDDLERVPGIGPAKLASIRDLVTV